MLPTPRRGHYPPMPPDDKAWHAAVRKGDWPALPDLGTIYNNLILRFETHAKPELYYIYENKRRMISMEGIQKLGETDDTIMTDRISRQSACLLNSHFSVQCCSNLRLAVTLSMLQSKYFVTL
jgi:hypothetical protein